MGKSKATKKTEDVINRATKGRQVKLEKKKEKRQRQADRQKEREQLGDKAPAKEVPKTIESMREYDVTVVDPADEEVQQDEAGDEFSTYFNREHCPKVLITISPHARVVTWKFCHELRKCIPNSDVMSRKNVSMKKLAKQATDKGFTDIVVVHEDRKAPSINLLFYALVICHLPEGPTAHFKLSAVTFTEQLKKHGESTSHLPELILNNFSTRLGHTVGRMFASLFPHDPQFKGRRAVTLHNQRDFIFFRHHRYEFKKEGEKAALLELGPRFTLKLRWLQKGTFDSKHGEYIWIHKRHEMEKSRKLFFL